MKPIEIIFIQHATEVSGSLMSLYYTVQGMGQDKNFKMKILCKSPEITKWYLDKDIEAEHFSSIKTFAHCSGHTYDFTNIIDIIKFFRDLFLLPFSIKKQYQRFKNESAPYIHLNSSTLLSSAIAAKLAGKKVVWHIREVLSEGLLGFRKKIWQRFYLNLADRIVCISEMEASAIAPKGHSKIEIVYNFIPFDKFQVKEQPEDIFKRYQIPTGKKYLLTLGGSNPIKATSTLLESLQFLGLNYHVIVAGDSSQYLKFNRSIVRRIISIIKILLGSKGQWEYWKLRRWQKAYPDRIHFIGTVSHIPDIINASWALFFGFTIPHFPRPVFEAWYLFRPAISIRLHKLTNHIDHGKTGLLFEKNSSYELAEAIKSMEDNEFRASLAAEGHKVAVEKFDLFKNSKKLIDLYQSLNKG